MDTQYDFIQPEFLNILFFEQKNLVIFPYVDLKHLHALELFTVGYNAIDLESTILHNLKEIIEFDSINSYSSNRSFYFIYNLNKEKIEEILEIPEIRCILNTNENINDLHNDHNEFIFYNKKSKTFINYDFKDEDLEFERFLISSSENETVLIEEIQKIKIIALKIFNEVNNNPNSPNLAPILKEYDKKYWNKILRFVKLYFKINLPKTNFSKYSLKTKPQQYDKDYSNEYEAIILQNLNIAKEFIQLLHDYRSDKVNSSNLELEQLYNPQKLYNYLRNHHWKNGLPKEFLSKWVKMQKTGRKLNDDDLNDLVTILKKIKVNESEIGKFIGKNLEHIRNPQTKEVIRNIPSVHNFDQFKDFLIKRINKIENTIKNRVYN